MIKEIIIIIIINNSSNSKDNAVMYWAINNLKFSIGHYNDKNLKV